MHTEIPKATDLAKRVFTINSRDAFEALALAVFRFQYAQNTVYRSYCDAINKESKQVNSIIEIPFLPISFFKTHNVSCASNSMQGTWFESSGTTGANTSRHSVPDLTLYETSFRNTFASFYGPTKAYCMIGLLPSYLERQHSSLVYMVQDLIKQSRHPESGFYLYDFEKLATTLAALETAGQKTILFGVTYALLDFAKQHPMPLQHTILIETGGMKGRKKEWLREEVHGYLKKSFALDTVHSEYGMTELVSQAYSKGNGRFLAPPWMQVQIREEDDPLTLAQPTKTGGINIIDLANLYSCAFIATEDAGRVYPDGSFEVLGRLDNSQIRGCSLLAL